MGAQLADRLGARKVLIVFFLVGFVTLAALSFKPSMFLLYLLIAIAGATTTGSQIIANSYVSQYYPTEIRSTGVGWALGIGRIGGLLGPAIGGFILNQNLPLQVNFLSFAIPCILAAIGIWTVQEKHGQVVQAQSTKHKKLAYKRLLNLDIVYQGEPYISKCELLLMDIKSKL